MTVFVLIRHGQLGRTRRRVAGLRHPAAYWPRHFETLKRQWEQRFERRFGFWQAYWDCAVFSYLDCGRFESGLRSSSFGQARRSFAEAAGFARVVCPGCR
jgi:hypothetical protein